MSLRFFCLLIAAPLLAQQPRALTAADYANAEKFMPYNTAPLVLHGGVRPNWISDDRFWYSTNTEKGVSFFVFDTARRASTPAFDQAKVAAALSEDAAHLNVSQIDARSVTVTAKGKRFTCDLAGTRCDPAAPENRNQTLSPDKKRAVFIRDWNLWVRDISTGKETQLTTDGVKDFGYATDNAGWTSSDRAILSWSPDSKKLATFQQDQRGVGEMYLVKTEVGHPELKAWKYPLPGDSTVTTIQRVVIDVDAARVVRIQLPPDQHRSSLCDDVACRGTAWSDVGWSEDGSHLAFLSTSRDHKTEQLRIADAATGAVRDVLEESVPTFFESGNGAVNWRYLAASDEIIWFSERSGWGHLYLYDTAGKLKNAITSG
ncbi:MAG TPA: DPP IV N-terminal domain-containing protein, partial [Bryobacteraceae bacterium]|nr:DPP IV N-terminal domain-containing protein [Bryobacteraceae bacterium]